jgi:glycosyltransferase involved in cell wall biosynthesis
MKTIVLVTNDVIGDSCAGPGIRYIEIGKMMARKGYDVALLGKKPSFSSPQPFIYDPLTTSNLIRHLRKSDTLIIRGGGPLTTLIALLFSHNKDRIADLYAFTHFEVPHLLAETFLQRYIIEVRKIFHGVKLSLYSRYFTKFWVANERQREFLSGAVDSAGIHTGQEDIAIIPFGYPSAKPVKRKNVLRGVVDGINTDDFILIWGGGVWDWLDPVTLVKAMALVGERTDKIKLYFMGMKAPSGYVPEKGRELIGLSRELGLLNRNVFMNEGWTPYDARTDYLLEADVGVSLHPASLETYYSFRTRNLDYVYCGLPMIHTEGDVWADMIERNKLGFVVSPGDQGEVAEKILELYTNPSLLSEMKKNINTFFPTYTWETVGEKAVQSIEKSVGAKETNLLFLSVDVAGKYFIFGLKSFYIFFRTIFRSKS